MSVEKSDGEVEIIVGGRKVSGWTEVEISGGLDMMPAIFSLSMTERYPNELNPVLLQPGDPCTIKIGGDVVMVGYINRVPRSLGPSSHVLRVEGRSRCQDLVDCSAIPDNMTISNLPIGGVAQQLVGKFAGITVKTPDGNGTGEPYTISVSLNETPFEIINQIASYEGLLTHDDAKGDLVICKVGTTKFASGFEEGANIQTASVSGADDMVYGTYVPVLMAQDTLALFGPGGNAAGKPVSDPMVKRYRPLIVVSDQPKQGQLLAQQRAVWEATRRRGRAQAVTLTCDSWRDAAGTLWTHNVLAPVHIPTLRINRATWIVASWKFVRAPSTGTTAEIVLMPPEAFSVEPTALNSTNRLIKEASDRADAARAAAIGKGTDPVKPPTAPNASTSARDREREGYGI